MARTDSLACLQLAAGFQSLSRIPKQDSLSGPVLNPELLTFSSRDITERSTVTDYHVAATPQNMDKDSTD